MKEKQYKWAVKTESKGTVQWKSVAFCESRKIAREMKKSQKAVWKMCSGVKVSIHKSTTARSGGMLIGSVEHY